MLKLLRARSAGEAGFTLIELLVVVLIVGVLAAVGVPLYLGYVRDARLAEGKALAGSAITALQACAQQDTGGTTCTLNNLSAKIGVNSSGVTGDGKWAVTIANSLTLNTTSMQFASSAGSSPFVTVAGQANTAVSGMATAGFVSAGNVTLRCNTSGTSVTNTDSSC